MVSVIHALSNPRQVTRATGRQTYPCFSRDADLPLQEVHGTIGSFCGFGVEALDEFSARAEENSFENAYEWVVLAPLLALLGKTGPADPRHGG